MYSVDDWEGLHVYTEVVDPIVPERPQNWKELMGRRQSELMLDHYFDITKASRRAVSTPPSSRKRL